MKTKNLAQLLLLAFAVIASACGELIPDDIIMGILKEELDTTKAEIVIFDGVPRNTKQAALMKKYGILSIFLRLT